MLDLIFIASEYFALILVIMLIFIFAFGYFFSGQEIQEYTPNIKGRITKNGFAIQDCIIELRIKSSNHSLKYRCPTNEDGVFTFNSVLRKRRKVLSIFDGIFQKMLSIEISAIVDNKKAIIWKGISRQSSIENNERENMSNLHCEVSNPIKKYDFHSYGDSVLSQCELIKFLRVNR
ncbi:DUF6795 domain-containing protein [Vibrio diabolicus]|uniref:DUF6795 domain-containing protein n=1 Tax=Vibrio diabolicus TaxID=50719 RepID=UPI00375046F8